MTLCIAAACRGDDARNIVLSADQRIEMDHAGGEVAFKLRWVHHRPAFFAGDIGKAEDLILTLNHSFAGTPELDSGDSLSRVRDVVEGHKGRLIDSFVKQKLGISYRRFRERGKREIPSDLRRAIFFEIEKLTLGCDVIIATFVERRPRIILIDESGEVEIDETFVAIGSGATAAESALFYRAQSNLTSVGTTLYQVYEAHRLSYAQGAPGVGLAMDVMIISPADDGKIELRAVMREGKQFLANYFAQYGPRPITTTSLDLPPDNARNFFTAPSQ